MGAAGPPLLERHSKSHSWSPGPNPPSHAARPTQLHQPSKPITHPTSGVPAPTPSRPHAASVAPCPQELGASRCWWTRDCVLSPDLVFSITCSPVSSKRPKLPPCTQLCLKKPWEVTQPSALGPAPGDTQRHRGCSAQLKPAGSSGGGPGSPPAVGLLRSPDCICECPLALQGRREDGRAGRWSMWRTGLEAASTFGAFPSPGLVQGSG